MNSKSSAILILIVHYLTNIIIGLIFRNYKSNNQNNQIVFNKTSKPFGTVLAETIENTIQTLLLILGTVTFFLVVSTILNNMFDFGLITKSIICGLIEMTQGLKFIGMLSIPTSYKSIISVMILSFGGLSVHMQVISILNGTKIKYMPFLIARILHCLISGFIMFILMLILQ